MVPFANPQDDTNVLRLVLASGSIDLPSVVFANDVTNGLYWDIAGLHLTGLAAPTNDGDAANKAYVDTTAGSIAYPLTAPDGTAEAPSYTFASQPSSGIFVAAPDFISVTCVGTELIRFGIEDTPGTTSLYLYDRDTNSLQQVLVGDADSGGTGFKLLKIPN